MVDTVALKAHLISEHPTKELSIWEACNFCGVSCKSTPRNPDTLGRHIRRQHGLNILPNMEKWLGGKVEKKGSSLPNRELRTWSLKARRRRMEKVKLAPVRNPKQNAQNKQLEKGSYLCSLCPSVDKPMPLVEFYGHVIFHYSKLNKKKIAN